MTELVLSLRGITRAFGALTANDGIDLELKRGEILALLGENGAGKTTLMNILFGHYVADAGEVLAAGASGALAPLPPGSPHAALAAGIGMVHQHFTLADNLPGFDNIMLGTEPLWRPLMRRRAARDKLADLMRRSGLAVDLDVPVAQLSVGERQRVEILKALYREVRILVLDEPTAVLTPQESETLFETLRSLARNGLSVIFISHKLNEVLVLADRIAVLRGGRKVADVPVAGQNRATLAALMVGDVVMPTRRAARTIGEPMLELDDADLTGSDARTTLRGVSLTLHAGEIVGIAGVSGNGQSALAALIGGLAAPSGGRMRLFAAEPTHHEPSAFVRAGVGRIPEDRHRDGIIGAMTIAENITLEDIRSYQRCGLLDHGAMRARARTAIEAYAVKCSGPDAPIGVLSGGNIQKLILARVLDRAPRLILANQPTRGLDVGAISEVHRRLLAARDAGAGIVLISEDLDEIFALADRIAVMFRGTLTAPQPAGTFDRHGLGALMGGHSEHRAERSEAS